MSAPGAVEESASSVVSQTQSTSSMHPSLKMNVGTHDVMQSEGRKFPRILEAKFEELDNNFARSMEQAELKVCL